MVTCNVDDVGDLGNDVSRCSPGGNGVGVQPVLVCHVLTGQPEVGDLERSVGGDEKIGWLQVLQTC